MKHHKYCALGSGEYIGMPCAGCASIICAKTEALRKVASKAVELHGLLVVSAERLLAMANTIDNDDAKG